MERMIAVDKLARPEDHILVPRDRMRKRAQRAGTCRRRNAMPHEEDFLKSRMHGICGGEIQAMEAAGRTLFDFPTRRGNSSSIWRGRCGTNRATPRFI